MYEYRILVTNNNNVIVDGEDNIGCIILSQSDGLYFDWNDNTFKNYNNINKLTNDQKLVFDSVDFKTNNTYLLYGVTGSGKTEVYLNLINEFFYLFIKSNILTALSLSALPFLLASKIYFFSWSYAS